MDPSGDPPARRAGRPRKEQPTGPAPRIPVPTKTRACAACEKDHEPCSGHTPCRYCLQTNQRCNYNWIPSNEEPLIQPVPLTHSSESQNDALAVAKSEIASLRSLISLSEPSQDEPHWSRTNPPNPLPSKQLAALLRHNFLEFGLPITGFVHEKVIFDSFRRLYDSHPSAPTCWTDNDLALDRAIVYATISGGYYHSWKYEADNRFPEKIDPSVEFYNQARVELDKTNEVSPKSLHAKILLTQCLLDHFQMHDAWILFGTVTRDAHTIRLHRRTVSRSNTEIVGNTQCLFWTIYTYDQILGSIFGQPAVMRDEDNNQEERGLAGLGMDPWSPATALLNGVRLAKAMGWLIGVLYTPHRERNASDLKAKAEQIELDLQGWEGDLRKYLESLGTMRLQGRLANRCQRQQLIVMLLCWYVHLLLYRPFLRPATSKSDPESWPIHCRNESIRRAQQILDACSGLHEIGIFSRRSWLISHVHFVAAATLYVCFILRPEDEKLRARADRVLERYNTETKGEVDGQYIEILWKLQKVTMALDCGRYTAAKTQTDPSALEAAIFDLIDPYGSQCLTRY